MSFMNSVEIRLSELDRTPDGRFSSKGSPHSIALWIALEICQAWLLLISGFRSFGQTVYWDNKIAICVSPLGHKVK